MHGAACCHQFSQDERPAASVWPASKGSPYPSAGNEGSFSPAIASFSPQPVADSPPLCDGSKALYFWTPCHSSWLYQAQQWCCALCGCREQPLALRASLRLTSVVGHETSGVAAGQNQAGRGQPHRTCWGSRSECSFGPLFWTNAFSPLCESRGLPVGPRQGGGRHPSPQEACLGVHVGGSSVLGAK